MWFFFGQFIPSPSACLFHLGYLTVYLIYLIYLTVDKG